MTATMTEIISLFIHLPKPPTLFLLLRFKTEVGEPCRIQGHLEIFTFPGPVLKYLH